MAVKHHRFRKRFVLIFLFGLYLVFCQSCMRMRFSPKETSDFFTQKKLVYKDTTVVINDFSLHYVETGNPDAPTLYFIHGSPGSWNAYRAYLSDPKLLARFRMIAVDRTGFGYSDFGDAKPLSIQVFLLNRLIESTGNPKPKVLVGHSLGGPIVVQMAAEHPERYQNLVVLAGSVDPDEEGNPAWRAFIGAKPLRYLIPGAMRTSNDELISLRGELELLRPKLKNVTASVTIVHGTKDPLVPFGNAAFLKKELTSATKVEVIPIEKANHFIPWEHYAEIRDVLENLEIQE